MIRDSVFLCRKKVVDLSWGIVSRYIRNVVIWKLDSRCIARLNLIEISCTLLCVQGWCVYVCVCYIHIEGRGV